MKIFEIYETIIVGMTILEQFILFFGIYMAPNSHNEKTMKGLKLMFVMNTFLQIFFITF